ncbi:hypothetical protein G6O67_008434 [Ophiocordyceps sinensis]|uniref:N-acetyltransferase domain-containing protein n=1 Tax=Ophiocordyceps sinensis TaxID=72228 RepID=A0A8H4LSR7_9HYPO|nr:hypothetical protein G6O67_008434 [Ophiocordyceps sinensis]
MDELLRPPTKTDNTILVERLAKCLLSVAICLPNSLDSKIQTVMSTPPPQTEEPESKLRYTITGFVCLAPLQLGMERHRSSSLAICIANAYQTRGYGGEAVNWALDWGFRHANLHRMALAPHLRTAQLKRMLAVINGNPVQDSPQARPVRNVYLYCDARPAMPADCA